jgi:DNA helicase HerA-like ATPase
MFRDIVLVIGKTGFGKSWWSKLFAQKYARKFIYDPAMSKEYECLYSSMNEIMQKYDEGELETDSKFSLGVILPTEVEGMVNLSFGIGNNLLVLEELGTFFPKGMRQLPDYMMKQCFLGRHRACSMVLIAQRAISIPIDLRGQFNRIVTFQQSEDDDVSWLIGKYGREKAESIPFLPKFTCLDNWDGQVSSYSISKQVYDVFRVKLDSRNNFNYNGII